MKQETIEELKARGDANREKADQAECKELEKAGRLAAMQDQTLSEHAADLDASQKVELNEITGQQADALAKYLNRNNDKGDQTEARRTAIREAYEMKIALDREQSRDRGR